MDYESFLICTPRGEIASSDLFSGFFLEFMQLLEILHLDHRTVKLGHHFRDLCQSS